MTTCACGNCQFYDTQSKPAAKHADSGLCRYNPPMPRAEGNTPGLWPVVDSSDWCGHFAATVERFMSASERAAHARHAHSS